jgi:hypothetical protein
VGLDHLYLTTAVYLVLTLPRRLFGGSNYDKKIDFDHEIGRQFWASVLPAHLKARRALKNPDSSWAQCNCLIFYIILDKLTRGDFFVESETFAQVRLILTTSNIYFSKYTTSNISILPVNC